MSLFERFSIHMRPKWVLPILGGLLLLLGLAGAGAFVYVNQQNAAATATAEWLAQTADDDGDGLSNEQERTLGTDPLKADSDGDGLSDRSEAAGETNPTNPDTDGDGLLDGEEVHDLGTSPVNPDTDGDGVNDNVDADPGSLPTLTSTPTCQPPPGWQSYVVQPGDTLFSLAQRSGTTVAEIKQANCPVASAIYAGQTLYLPQTPVGNGTATAAAATATVSAATRMASTAVVEGDGDTDGLSDAQEAQIGTDPEDPDTDKDGLSDGDEMFRIRSDPLQRDTDGDILLDGDEVNVYLTDPTEADTDGDGEPDGVEIAEGTDPLATPLVTPSVIPTPPVETELTETDGNIEYGPIGLGRTEVRYPREMNLDEPAVVELVIAFNQQLAGQVVSISSVSMPDEASADEDEQSIASQALGLQSKIEYETEEGGIDIYPIMGAKLEGTGFEIIPNATQTQEFDVQVQDNLLWTWAVTPREAGFKTLLLTIFLPVEQNEQLEVVRSRTLDNLTINVEVLVAPTLQTTVANALPAATPTFLERSVNNLVNNTATVLGAILTFIVGILGVVIAYLNYRDKQTAQSRAMPVPATLDTSEQVALHRILDQYFNEQELRTLCLEMGSITMICRFPVRQIKLGSWWLYAPGLTGWRNYGRK